MRVVLCLNLGTISMLYPTFHKYCKAKHHRYFFFSWNPNTFVVKPYITYIASHTKVCIYFRFILKNIFTKTTVKYRFLCVFSRVRNFFFTAFDCAGSKIFERPKSFLQLVTRSLLFTGFDYPRSKIFEGESFLGLFQSFLFKAFCVKSSGTGEVAESFFWGKYF